MKKELKQLNRATFWLSQAIRAREYVKSNLWDATNTYGAVNFASIRQHHMDRAARCERIQLYCYDRYLKALESLNELTPLTHTK